MLKNFSEIAPNIPFSENFFYNLYKSTFEKSELGRIRKLLHLRETAEDFELTRKNMRPKHGHRPLVVNFWTHKKSRYISRKKREQCTAAKTWRGTMWSTRASGCRAG